MLKSIINQIKEGFSAEIVNKRLFFQVNEYCITMFDTENALICSLALPTLSVEPQLLNELLSNSDYDCEYNAPNFNVKFNLDDKLSFDTVSRFLDAFTENLASNGIKPNIYIRCLDESNERYNVNGYYCYVDKECANLYLEENSFVPKSKKSVKAMYWSVSMAFCLIGSLFYLSLGLLGIMPALAGIAMGLLGSLGFKFFNVKPSKKEKIIFFIASLLFATMSNTATDFIYAVTKDINIDFLATYSEPLNIFNTAFDTIAGAIISVSSLSLLLDIDRASSTCSIKKITNIKANNKDEQ